MKKKLTYFFIALISFLIISPSFVLAQVGGVAISPTRIVFEGRKRMAEVILMNHAAKPTTYRVSFANMKVEEDGSYTEIKEPGTDDRFADKLIRYSPRQVTIPAGSSQTVRLMVRKTKGLEPGEYRSHLFFKSLPPKDAGTSLEDLDLKEGELSIKMIAQYAISIPIIIRHGKLDVSFKISDLAFTPKTEEKKPSLAMKLNRDGNRSIYGDIAVNFRSVNGGGPVEVGRINGVSVYVPNKNRMLNIALNPPEGINLKSGTLHVKFEEDLKKGKGGFAEEKLAIN